MSKVYSSRSISFLDLGDDVIGEILLRMPLGSFARMSRTCRFVHRLAEDPQHWRARSAWAGFGEVPADEDPKRYFRQRACFSFDELHSQLKFDPSSGVLSRTDAIPTARSFSNTDVPPGKTFAAARSSLPLRDTGIERLTVEFSHSNPSCDNEREWASVGVASHNYKVLPDGRNASSDGWWRENNGTGMYAGSSDTYCLGDSVSGKSMRIRSGDSVTVEVNRSQQQIKFFVNGEECKCCDTAPGTKGVLFWVVMCNMPTVRARVVRYEIVRA